MLATIREMVSADFGAIHFIEDSVRAVIEKVTDGSPEVPGRFDPVLTDRWVVSEGFCVHVPSLGRAGDLSRYSLDGAFSSVVVMPLKSKGKVYGLLEVYSRAERHFTTDDLGFLALLALQAAGMIRNAEHLESLIFKDPLTHVYNRGYLEDQLEREIERYKRTNEPVAFLMVDVDNFKEVILPDTIGEHAVVTAERLRSVIEGYDYATRVPELGDMKMTISLGGAICPDDAVTKENLIESADRALAEAERAGKNRAVFFGVSSAGEGA
jgi:GGDEF domain-containing protein